MSVKSGDSGDIARNAKDPLSVAALRRILGEALSLELPYPERPPRPGGKPAAVLALFGEHEGEPALLLTRRTETVDTHKGQMAFPGGKAEPHEIGMGTARCARLCVRPMRRSGSRLRGSKWSASSRDFGR